MSVSTFAGRMICLLLSLLTISGCFHPPFNNFREDKRTLRQVAFGTAVGAGTGAVIGMVAGSTGMGAAIGGATGAIIAWHHNQRKAIIAQLKMQDIQLVEYGDTTTLIIPTDHFFVFDTPRLNDICYPGLNNIIRLLKYYPCTTIYVAGFTDNVGSRYHKKMLSQARAEAILTFLWANNIQAQRMHAEGYEDKFDIGDNKLIHGSAYNRRIEIQIVKAPAVSTLPGPYYGGMK